MVRFDDIIDADIVVIFNHYTTFEAFFNFFGIILESLQAGKFAVENDDIVPDDTDTADSSNIAIGYERSTDCADFRNFIGLTDKRLTSYLLFEFRIQHALHRCFDFIDGVVDDTV